MSSSRKNPKCPEEMFVISTREIQESLKSFRKYMEVITRFRHLTKREQNRLIKDFERDTTALIRGLRNLQAVDTQ